MDIGARLAIFAIVEKEPWDNATRGRTKSMSRLTHVIPSMLIKDRTVVGTSDNMERMPLT